MRQDIECHKLIIHNLKNEHMTPRQRSILKLSLLMLMNTLVEDIDYRLHSIDERIKEKRKQNS